MRRPADIVLAVVLTALFGGCGQSASNAPVTHTTQSTKPKSGAAQTGDFGIDPDMVSAVNVTGSSSNLLSMKFKLESRPIVTAPLQVRVLMIPAANVEIAHLHVLFQPGDGLQLQSERNIDLSEPAAGTPIEQQVTVVPQQTGVLSLNATVLIDTATESVSRTYAIPLIAADSHS